MLPRQMAELKRRFDEVYEATRVTHKEVFKEMLDSAGMEYTEKNNEDVRFQTREIRDLRKGLGWIVRQTTLDLLIVEGTFYEELLVFFDPDDGSLVEMQSHVAFSNPASTKLKKRLGLTNE